MSNIKVLIVEDNELHAAKAVYFAEKLNYEVSAVTSKGDDVETLVDELQPDVLLLDIQIEGSMSGIDVAKSLRKKGNLPIIFLTSHKDKSILDEAIGTRPDAVLHKPINKQALQNAIELAVFKFKSDGLDTNSIENGEHLKLKDALFVKVGNALKKVALAEIVYVDVSYKNYCDIHTLTKSYAVKNSLSDLSESMLDMNFVRIQRAAVVNINYISEIRDRQTVVETPLGKLPIGNSYKRELLDRIARI